MAAAVVAAGVAVAAPSARAGGVELEDGGSWRPQASGLQATDATLSDVSCVDEDHCTAVGAEGIILATDDGGGSWRVEREPRRPSEDETKPLDAVSCPSVQRCVAVGWGGLILVTSDGGDTWQQPQPGDITDVTGAATGVAVPLDAVSCPSELHCVAMGGSQRGALPPHTTAVLRSEDGGETWTRQPDVDQGLTPHIGVSCVDPPAVGGRGLAHCQAVGLNPYYNIAANGQIFGSKDGGHSWRAEVTASQSIPVDVDCISVTHCYTVTERNGYVLATVDGGTTWTPRFPAGLSENDPFGVEGGTEPLSGVSCVNASRCVAVGGNPRVYEYNTAIISSDPGRIVTTNDGGVSWQARESGTRAPLFGVSCPSPDACVAVGAAGTIVASDDGGQTWMRQHAGNLADVTLTDKGHGHAVGAGGLIVATANRGASWNRHESGTSMDLNAVAFAEAADCPTAQPACHGWAVGHAGTILATSDGGQSWQPQQSATTVDLTNLVCVDADRCWASGRYPDDPDAAAVDKIRGNADARPATIVATSDGGKTWAAQYNGGEITDLACPTADTCYAVNAGNSVVTTSDGGDTWTVNRDVHAHRLACPTAQQCLTIFRSEVWVTDDGGATWEQRGDELPLSDPKDMACRDGDTCWVATGRTRLNDDRHMGGLSATAPGAVWVTDDFGQSWTEQAKMSRYSLRAVTLGSEGDAPAWAVGYGGTIISTLDLLPGEVTPSVEQVDATTVELSWSAVGLDGAGGHGPAQRYQIRQATSPIETEEDFAAARPLCELGDCLSGEFDEIGDPVTFTVSDLDPGTTYHWAVRAVDEGRGDEDVKFGPLGTATLTLPEVAPAAVDDLTATALSDREIELGFSAVGSDGDRPPPAEEYVVKQARAPIDDTADFAAATTLCDEACAFEPGAVGDDLTVTFDDLSAETTYHYAVRARDDAGELSALSNPAAATTLAPGETLAGEPGEIGRVDDLAATAQSDSEIALGWSAVSDRDGQAIDAYVVAQSAEPIENTADFDEAFALCGGVCDQFDLSSDAVGEQLALTVGDLTPGTTYHYAIAALAPDGQRGPTSPSTSATTLGDAPADTSPGGDGPAGDDAGVETAAEDVLRVSGADRIATAVAASREAFAAGQAEAAVVARADDFADGLAGVPLAAAENGPLLLTHSGRLDERVAGELNRVLADGARVFVLGGRAALADSVEARIADLGFEPVRLAGASRFETAAVIAEDGLGAPDEVLFATGGDFADAVTAGAAAARREAAVLLSAGDRLPPPTASYRDRHPAGAEYAVGGPAARAVPQATPLVGATRFETAAVVADELFTAPATVGVATGLAFPDALSGGAHIAAYSGPMLLSGPDRLHPAAGAYLTAQAPTIETAIVYGGPAALADAVANQTSAAITGDS